MQSGSSEDIAVEMALGTTNSLLTSILAATGGGAYAVKMTESGAITYIAKAAVGSAAAAAVWQVQKLDETSGIVITWADGDSDFDNVATDLTALIYS